MPKSTSSAQWALDVASLVSMLMVSLLSKPARPRRAAVSCLAALLVYAGSEPASALDGESLTTPTVLRLPAGYFDVVTLEVENNNGQLVIGTASGESFGAIRLLELSSSDDELVIELTGGTEGVDYRVSLQLWDDDRPYAPVFEYGLEVTGADDDDLVTQNVVDLREVDGNLSPQIFQQVLPLTGTADPLSVNAEISPDRRTSNSLQPSAEAAGEIEVLLSAQQRGAEEKAVQLVRTTVPPVIDGILDDEVWNTAAIVEDLHQILPFEYSEPDENTIIYLLFDQNAIYIGAKLLDSDPENVTARVLRQGELPLSDDSFEVILSPFDDQRSGYVFAVNPNGVRSESLYRDAIRTLSDWEGIWEARSTIDDDGWQTELVIPLKTLSFDRNSDTWGINFTRKIARTQETIGWVSRDRGQNPSISGIATGLEGLDQGFGLDIVPSLSLREFKQYSPDGTRSESEPSVDMFYKFTPALTGVLTLNTDFSDTEVDDRQVNLTRFGLFFPEKRDFFLQDADIFEFGRLGIFSGPDNNNARPFFSRNIGLSASREPVGLEGGAKLSGRAGRWNIGMLAVRQEQFEDVDATDLFVGRVAANILRESSIGAIVTNGDPHSNLDNGLYGVDFRYYNSRLASRRTLEGELWFQRTDTPGLEGNDRAAGFAIRSNNREKLGGYFNGKEIQENYRPELGFVNRVGIRNVNGSLYYIHRPQESPLRTLQTRVTFDRYERISDGGVESASANYRLVSLENHTGDSARFDVLNVREGLVEPFPISESVTIPVGDYEFDRYAMALISGTQRKLSGSLIYEAGDFYAGQSRSMRSSITWRPSEHLRLNLDYRVDDVELPEGDFVTRLTQLRSDIVFSARWSWVNLIQWDNVSSTIGINSRLHWIPQAGREIFFVLNHNLQDLDRNRSFHSDTAEITAKINYTFRF